jgi:hypothetical protein
MVVIATASACVSSSVDPPWQQGVEVAREAQGDDVTKVCASIPPEKQGSVIAMLCSCFDMKGVPRPCAPTPPMPPVPVGCTGSDPPPGTVLAADHVVTTLPASSVDTTLAAFTGCGNTASTCAGAGGGMASGASGGSGGSSGSGSSTPSYEHVLTTERYIARQNATGDYDVLRVDDVMSGTTLHFDTPPVPLLAASDSFADKSKPSFTVMGETVYQAIELDLVQVGPKTCRTNRC